MGQLRAVQADTTVIEQQVKTEFTEEDKLKSFLEDWRERLSATELKNPSIRRQDVALVQAFNLLRKSILEADGANVKMRTLVLDTLGELLKNKKMPLSIPVLKTKRLVVTENLDVETLDGEDVNKQLVLNNFQADIESYNAHMETANTTQTSQQLGDDTEATRSLYAFLQDQVRKFPLGDLDMYNQKGTPIQTDTDFFRESMPKEIDEDGEPEAGIIGLDKVQEFNKKKHSMDHVEEYDPNSFIKKNIQLSLRRALQKQSEGELTQKVDLQGHILFPYDAASLGVTGAKRSGRLWETMKRGSMPKIPMDFVVNENFYGPVDTSVAEGTDTTKAIYFKADNDERKEGENANTIDFNKYLSILLKSVFYEGPADVHPLKLDLGIENFELTTEQMTIIKQRIESILLTLKSYIAELRKTAIEQAKAPIKALDNSFSPGQVLKYKELEATYEPLKKLMNTLAERMPNYSQIDIAIVAQCLRDIPDYFFAILTQGQPKKIQTEEERLKHTEYKQEVYNIIKQQIYDDERKIQYKPERKPCGKTPEDSHYTAIDIVRSRGDFKLRMQTLEQAIREFLQTNKDPSDPWYKCKQCKEHLICQHEWLQYQQYKNPSSYNILQKEIILTFAGGSFGANYICRNCGLPIADIGFDIKTELREGSAMEVVLDEEAERKKEEETMNIVSRITSGLTGDKQKDDILPIARALYLSMGIEFDTTLFFKNVYPMVDYCITQQLPESKFKTETGKPEEVEEPEGEDVEEEESKKEEGPELKGGAKDGKPAEKKGNGPTTRKKFVKKGGPKKGPRKEKKESAEYIEYKTRNQIGSLAASILVDLQTATPEYQIGSQMATERFGGFPLELEPEPVLAFELKNRTNSDGLSNLLVLIDTMPKSQNPWKQLYLKTDEPRENFNTMKPFLETNLKLLLKRSTLQAIYRKKRQELQSANTERLRSERLPTNFFPLLQTIKTGVQTVPEGAKATKIGNALLAAKWIKEANGLAKETAVATSGYKFMESACCIAEKSVVEPGKWWSEHSPGNMPRRDPFQAPYRRNTVANVPFTADPVTINEMKPAEEDKFNLFLSVCSSGPNKGRPHELHYEYTDGVKYTYVCDWCNLEVDEKFFMPPTTIDKDGKIVPYSQAEIEKIRQNVISAGIDSNTDFEPLLNRVNTLSEFTQYQPKPFVDRNQVFEALASLDPPPTDAETIVVKPEATTESELVGTWSKWINAIKEKTNIVETVRKQVETIHISVDKSQMLFQDVLLKRESGLTENSRRIVGAILKSSIDLKQKVLRDYILIPAQRILSKMQPNAFKINDKYYKLNNPELRKKLDDMLEEHLAYLNQTSAVEEENRTDADLVGLRGKFNTCIEASHSALLVGPHTIILEDRVQIWNAIVVGILASLLENTGDRDFILRKRFVEAVLSQFASENVSFDAEKVLLEVDKLKEKEKLSFIDDLDKLTVEERQIELAKKKLGIGRWAIGGTKLVFQYDPDQWSRNMEQAKHTASYESVVRGDESAIKELEVIADEGEGYGLGFGREEGNEDEFE